MILITNEAVTTHNTVQLYGDGVLQQNYIGTLAEMIQQIV